MTAARIGQLATHLDPRTWSGKGLAAHSAKHDDDVVIVASGRTAFCKAKKGQLKDTPFDILVMEMFKALLAKADVDPSVIEEVVVGNVRNDGAAYNVRAAALAAGIPDTAPTLIGRFLPAQTSVARNASFELGRPVLTATAHLCLFVLPLFFSLAVNRFCSSGLMAVRSVANQIQAGEIDCGLAVGAESMTNHVAAPTSFSPEVEGASQQAADCKMPMGWTSENVAGDFNISRERMDTFAARSQQRAAAAQKSGKFDAEILPITVPVTSGGERSYATISQDDGIRDNSTPEALGKVKPAFPQWPPAQTTGGNASQLTDGAAGVLLMRRSLARKLGKRALAKYVATAVSGLAPRVMGIGPTYAIPRLLEKTGLSLQDVDVVEINEAFASMGVYCEDKLGLNSNNFNVNGGAIALGHPLGAVNVQ